MIRGGKPVKRVEQYLAGGYDDRLAGLVHGRRLHPSVGASETESISELLPGARFIVVI